jgi:hypothetical protein
MVRTFVIFLGLTVMLVSGVAAAAGWWLHDKGGPAMASAEQIRSAYGRVRAGATPVSKLASLGLDTRGARRLSPLGVMEQFMPKDSRAFDGLDPAVQTCFTTQNQCTAYVFAAPGAKAVLLIEGGRVAYKTLSAPTHIVAAAGQQARCDCAGLHRR